MTEHETATATLLNGNNKCLSGIKASNEIKVTVHIPENVHETVRTQKINRIYDILNPENLH